MLSLLDRRGIKTDFGRCVGPVAGECTVGALMVRSRSLSSRNAPAAVAIAINNMFRDRRRCVVVENQKSIDHCWSRRIVPGMAIQIPRGRVPSVAVRVATRSMHWRNANIIAAHLRLDARMRHGSKTEQAIAWPELARHCVCASFRWLSLGLHHCGSDCHGYNACGRQDTITYLSSWGTAGTGNGQYSGPDGIAVG